MNYSVESMKRYKWPVMVSQKIEVSPDKIWSVISNPRNLEDCHPFCEKNEVYKWSGVGSKDAIHYHSGWVLHRDFVNWIDGVGYDLTIGREGERKSFVSWRITEEQENVGKLHITIYPHIFQNIPIAIRWIPYVAKIQPELRKYLKSVVRGFEWFIITGTPVRKDQFGSHSWFSSKDD